VPARHHEHDGRVRDLAVVEHQRLDVPGQVVHGHDRNAARGPDRLGEAHADEQRPHQPGALRHGDGVDVGPRRMGVTEGLLDYPDDVAQVLPCREFWHDATPLPMDRHLRGDDARAQLPGGRPGRLDDGRGRLVAAALDAEHAHQRVATATGAPNRAASDSV
jgi:hypothetical protein